MSTVALAEDWVADPAARIETTSAEPDATSPADYETRVQELARLAPIEYDRIRKSEAEHLGVRTITLDGEVERLRADPSSPAQQGSSVTLAPIEPWPHPVDVASVLDAVSGTFRQYVVMPDGAADVLALFCAHTHCFTAFLCSPRLNIQSPEKGCGKTTLRDVVALFVPKPLQTENMTVAVLFRLIEAHTPTVLADEYDAWLMANEELRGLLNAGHRRGSTVYRCEGDKNEVRGFAAFAPAVLCGIGALPGTLHDRSIVIRLERAKPGELLTRFDSRRTLHEQNLGRKLARWTSDHFAELESADPILPAGVYNRSADNWRPLFAIAELAGMDWPQRAAVAFSKLSAKVDLDAEGLGTMLLADIRDVLTRLEGDRISVGDLADELVKLEDRPWPEIAHGRPITTVRLSRMLKRFGLISSTKRNGPQTFKGYDRNAFADVFARYLPPNS
jgi:hypothetical protein